MATDKLLECGILDYQDDDDNVNVHIHLKNKEILVFDKIISDPIFYRGWFTIHYTLWGKSWTSIIREEDVSYLSYYSTKKEVKDEK